MLRKLFHVGKTEVFSYPDLPEMGGLAPALQRIFDEMCGDAGLVKCDASCGSAVIREGSRHSTVAAGANERTFHIDLWHQGVQYGSGWTSELREIARAAVAFYVEKASIHQITKRFTWFEPNEQAASHEQGAEFFVSKKWENLERLLASGQCAYLSELLPLVMEAAKRSELRRLLPFTSLRNLCFSRTTGYPYTNDCPSAWPLNGGTFRVTAVDRKTVLGEGNVAVAADLLAANIPRNWGSAVHGTAEDLEPLSGP
jgi:hypothetical protein